MKDVISLGVGEPDFVTPWHIRDASFDALSRGFTSYTSNRGMSQLLEAIADYLMGYNLHYDPDRELLVTVGGSEAIDLALRAMLSPGDEVLIPEPAYVSYRPCAALAGGVPVAVPTRWEAQFRVSTTDLESQLTARSKVLVMCYPNNPTGAVLSETDLQELATFCVQNDLLVISDEIYAELSYGGKHHSIAEQPGMRDRTVVVSGMSKAFAMTGWRIGYAAGPEDILSAMLKIHQYAILCAPVMGQMAAIEALQHGEREKQRMVEEYDRRRRLMVEGLRSVGLSCHEPQGAFYAFPDIRSTGFTAEAFAEELLRQQRVAVVPGTAFGEAGEGFVRCSYATSADQIEQAIQRMGHFLTEL
ncbi:aminotransferase class I/II-fold pyridoxal phosphate-dependent enzyme [Alicyclobacillaceae bacterium I2511]|nr:aminotransferase class I/II-fold pyridoxal phosphate-dependent enzyme [Alicyclobacillaceae bacterium I2511]